jgi:fibrillarin-like pre-rRNA processing protein
MILILKTRSVDVRKEPDAVFQETVDALISAGFEVQESLWLAPYHQDHAAIVCKKPEV